MYDHNWFQKNYEPEVKPAGYYLNNISVLKEKLNEVVEDIDYKRHSWFNSFKSFFNGLYNFWKFRKIIFRDRFWDYSFLIDIIVFKLKDMEEHWVKYTHYEGDAFTKGRISVIRKKFEELDEKLMKIEEKHLNRCLRITLDEERREEWKKCKKESQKEIDAVFLLLARNYRKFWD